jgi:hypothetical protein
MKVKFCLIGNDYKYHVIDTEMDVIPHVGDMITFKEQTNPNVFTGIYYVDNKIFDMFKREIVINAGINPPRER